VSTQVPAWRHAAYGLLGMPLAMSALPVYVQIPVYYTTHLGLALASVGWIMFLARFVDALQDPLLGLVIDRLQGRLQLWFGLGALLLALAFYGLWLPPARAGSLTVWLALMLILAYMAHSMLNIAYLAKGARLGQGGGLLGAAAWREGAGLLGVIAASIAPSLIFSVAAPQRFLGWYCLFFAALLAFAVWTLLYRAPVWQHMASASLRVGQQARRVVANRAFRTLLLPYFLNAVSVAVPATLVLFFINDRLQAAALGWAFLATYFLAAAAGLPLWVRLARTAGVVVSWRIGMLLSIAAFASAGFLGSGAVLPFFVICAVSGMALGADLALPPVLLAQVIAGDDAVAGYFGVWTLLGKFALALSGLTLPVLAWLDYHPGQAAGFELNWVYAGVPCLLKTIALILLMRTAEPMRKS